ncbi:3-dehydroquinate synthase [Haloferula sargassicola]|uniref:3-dehydroquinate synthase n=1 Tax=Haloferula sargassicola TaxID=490096 RepID=A0ABP9UQL4_9BACT
MPTTHVDLPGREYDIVVEPGILDAAGERIHELGLRGACALITDDNVARHHADKVVSSLEMAGFHVSTHVVPAGEASKSAARFEVLCEEMAARGHDRSSFVVALGGGVVGDLAGYVAASYYRGIPFVQIPTTIVAQVDSSVGGKTGINLKQGKNLVGAFHQPALVLIDPLTLRTLPGREFREGFAEVIKHAAIRDAAMLDELAAVDPASPDVATDLIARNVAIKAAIVIEDERETSGTRALLNFGHTIGHGIEASVPYGEMLHGEAISLGIRAALFLSERRAGLAAETSSRVLALLEHFQLPLQLPETVTTETVMSRLSKDKKFEAGRIRFVLLRAAGEAFVSSEVNEDDLRQAIAHLRS